MEFSLSHVAQSLVLGAPLLVLLAAAVAVLVADLFLKPSARWVLPLFALAGLFGALLTQHVIHFSDIQIEHDAFFGALRLDYMGFLAHNVILAMGIFLVLMSPRWLGERLIPHGEYYALLLIAILSMMALASSSELLALFVNIEMLSITLYILTGLEKKNVRSSEAALKYFILGSFAAAFLLMGIALVFGATGTTRFGELAGLLHANKVLNPTFLTLGLGLMLVGFGFKLTLAPFHMYAPDVYDGAPTPVAAAIATGSKVAGFVALFRVIELAAAWTGLPSSLWIVLYAMAAVSMVVGNVGAVVQPNLKRMLAYSSIAHSAYTVVPMVVVLARPDLLASARDAVSYYLLAYTLMTLLAFGVAMALGPMGEGKIAHYAGLGRRSPVLAAAMTLAMISLVGIPPTVGFIGKIQLFGVAVAGGHMKLAILGVLASVASAFYYLRVTVTMYMEEPQPEAARAGGRVDGVGALALGLSALGILVFAIFPWLYLFGE